MVQADNASIAIVLDEWNLDIKEMVVIPGARENANSAPKERKIFEKLREKAFDEFVFEENRKEQKEVDELMSYKHGTKAV